MRHSLIGNWGMISVHNSNCNVTPSLNTGRLLWTLRKATWALFGLHYHLAGCKWGKAAGLHTALHSLPSERCKTQEIRFGVFSLGEFSLSFPTFYYPGQISSKPHVIYLRDNWNWAGRKDTEIRGAAVRITTAVDVTLCWGQVTDAQSSNYRKRRGRIQSITISRQRLPPATTTCHKLVTYKRSILFFLLRFRGNLWSRN